MREAGHVGFEEGETDKYNCLCRLFMLELERREKRIPDIGEREKGNKKVPVYQGRGKCFDLVCSLTGERKGE